jgi:hypothetical protein
VLVNRSAKPSSAQILQQDDPIAQIADAAGEMVQSREPDAMAAGAI